MTAGVLPGHGPSSKVRTTSCSFRKSYCLKCSKPNAGPPVVSICTVREIPMAPGLSQPGAAGLAALPCAPAAGGAGGAVDAPGLPFCTSARRVGATAGAGAGAATVGAAIGACNGAAIEVWAILGEGAVAAGMEAGAGAACMPLAASRGPLRCAAMTPNAARPKVASAATTMTSTLTVPSTAHTTTGLKVRRNRSLSQCRCGKCPSATEK